MLPPCVLLSPCRLQGLKQESALVCVNKLTHQLFASLQSGLVILSLNSVHLWESYATFMCFLNVIRDSARIEQLLTVVNSHHWSNLQTINSLCKRSLAEASSFAAPEK